jgi:hypothetical protein
MAERDSETEASPPSLCIVALVCVLQKETEGKQERASERARERVCV